MKKKNHERWKDFIGSVYEFNVGICENYKSVTNKEIDSIYYSIYCYVYIYSCVLIIYNWYTYKFFSENNVNERTIFHLRYVLIYANLDLFPQIDRWRDESFRMRISAR